MCGVPRDTTVYLPPLVFVTEVCWEEKRTVQSSPHIPYLEKVCLSELHYRTTSLCTMWPSGPLSIIYLDMEMTTGISPFYKYVKTSIRYSRQKQFPNEWSQTFWCFASFSLFSINTLLWPISTGWGELELLNPRLQTKPKHFLRAREEREVILDRFEDSLTS